MTNVLILGATIALYGFVGLVMFVLMALMTKKMKEVHYDDYVGFLTLYITIWPIMTIHFAIVLGLFLQEGPQGLDI